MSNIGIMGGTFNPIHNGHINMALQAYEQFMLSKVLVMPSGVPPHKKNENILSADDRCKMVKMAIEAYPQLEFSDIEVKRKGTTYTSDTLLQMYNIHDKIYFIIGVDSLYNIRKWHKPEIVMKLATLVVANRNEHSQDEILMHIKSLRHDYNANIEILNMPDIPISSSEIRYNIAHNINIDNMLCDEVQKYIRINNLYKQ